VSIKSSAVSVCIFPGPGGRDNVAILPSGSPVEKENNDAEAGEASNREANPVSARRVMVSFIILFLLGCFMMNDF
jgi:hypothetical protein